MRVVMEILGLNPPGIPLKAGDLIQGKISYNKFDSDQIFEIVTARNGGIITADNDHFVLVWSPKYDITKAKCISFILGCQPYVDTGDYEFKKFQHGTCWLKIDENLRRVEGSW